MKSLITLPIEVHRTAGEEAPQESPLGSKAIPLPPAAEEHR